MQQLHKFRPAELGAVVRTDALHGRRDTRCIDNGEKHLQSRRNLGRSFEEVRPTHSGVVVHEHHQELRLAAGRRPFPRKIYEKALQGTS